jgi:signal peptidase I
MQLLRKIYIALLDFVEAFVLVGAIFLIVYAFLFRPYQVNGESMGPNFQDKEYILTSLISLKISELERGDVIVFQAPTNAEKDYIKRVIGIPGDTVELINGKVYVNGQKLNEAYLSENTSTDSRVFLREGAVKTVPPDSYFVLGDNRSISSDSREWGFVKKEEIIGKSVLVYWPVNRFRILDSVDSK